VEVEEENLEIVAHHHYQELQIVVVVAEVLVLVVVEALVVLVSSSSATWHKDHFPNYPPFSKRTYKYLKTKNVANTTASSYQVYVTKNGGFR
jgi:hypothetical protein